MQRTDSTALERKSRGDAVVRVDRRAQRGAMAFLGVGAVILWIPVTAKLVGSAPVFLRDLGFVSGPGGTPVAWLLALGIAIAYAWFAVQNVPLVREHWRAVSGAKLLGVIAAVGAALVEEGIFRRAVMDAVMTRGGGALLQVMASGVIFGVAHGVWGVATRRSVAGVGAMVATGSLGLAWGVVYLVGGRSLAPVIISHFIIDAVIQPGILYAAFSGALPRPRRRWWRLRA